MSSRVWSFMQKYVLNIDTILAIVIFGLVIYFIIHAKPGKYKLRIPTINGVPDMTASPYSYRKKKKKRKLNKHEEECRRIFQQIFKCPFKSVRPDWLKNPATGKNLELDGFNEDVSTPLGNGLAFEYDGEQHSKYNSHFHKGNPQEFVYQVKKDSWKDMKCKEKQILLIRIPHFVNFNDLDRYIRQELRRRKVEIPFDGGDFLYRGGNMYA